MKNAKGTLRRGLLRAGCWKSVLVILHLALCAPLWAVKPGQWTHQAEADFSAGELQHVIVTNLGDVQLARAVESLAELEGEDSILYDIEPLSDGRIIAAVGPLGRLARLDNGAATIFAHFEGAQVFALTAAEDGAVWTAISGNPSRLELRGGPDLTVQRTIELPGVRYIWDIAGDGPRLWLATGTEGKVLVIDTAADEPQPVVAMDSPHTNLLCLGLDAAGRAYVGSDGDGIVYRITRHEDGRFDAFALFDAPEPEIGALRVLPNGTVFAGTADVEQAKPGRLEGAQTQPVGRVEPPAPGDVREKIPNVPPKPEPKPDAPPEGVPGAPAAQASAEDAAPAVAQPTPEQYEQLRAAVQQRLDQARRGGAVELQVAPAPPGQPAQSMPATASAPSIRSRLSGPAPSSTSKKGNAIYRISTDGFVREVFREVVVILRLIGDDRGLYAATGNEGELYYIDPEAEQVTLIAKLEPRQLPALARDGGGALLIGSANPGGIVRLADRYSASGTLRSATLDASQISLWGKLTVAGSAPPGTSVDVQTRSGNVNRPDDGNWWSPWSTPQTLSLDALHSGYIDVLSPPGRYLQYRLTLRSDGRASPTVTSLALRYLTPNLRPKIASIKTEYPARPSTEPQPLHTMKITWDASDPNSDKLTYTVEAREAAAADDVAFLPIARDLTGNTYEWDTRTIADGRYILRVTASDKPDNVLDQALESSRRSDPVLVDNTPPAIEDFNLRATGAGNLDLLAEIVDAMSSVVEVRYRVSGSEDWVLVLPADLIYDSTSERISVKITGLSPGPVSVTLRATDILGNSRFATQTVTVR